jgi:pentose-5-phosphate-3-epimerase/putative flippase GtrA
LYVLFGVLSLLLEFFIRGYLLKIEFDQFNSMIISVFIGIIFAFWANVNFNFKIQASRRNNSLKYFIIISLSSALLQWYLIHMVNFSFSSYELQRLILSGFIFIIAYFLHRKFSFYDFKKVGVAIYANGLEDLSAIYEKVEHYPDFIHVDLIDKTMSENAHDVKAYKLETMKAFWPKTQIQTHIMSYEPSVWLDEIIMYSDVIYVHAECNENIDEIFNNIKSAGKNAGLALTMNTKIADVIHYIKKADYLLLLTIPSPGNSGQKFDFDGLNKIKEVNALAFRNKFKLCIDGGINEDIINLLDAENIVSGSSVLHNPNPKRQIMRLQTVGRYGH